MLVAVAYTLFIEAFHEQKQNQDEVWKNFWKVFVMFFTIHQHAEKNMKVLPVPIHIFYGFAQQVNLVFFHEVLMTCI